MGLEPTTFRVTGGRSNQTELQPPLKYEALINFKKMALFCQKVCHLTSSKIHMQQETC